jgi:heme-degrading monooxygenase HmoA
MFARLLRMHIQENQTDRAVKIFTESVMPLLKKQKGYTGALFLRDKETSMCLPVTLWETEEDMKETEENRFFQEQLVKLMGLFAEPPVREAYEVVFKE